MLIGPEVLSMVMRSERSRDWATVDRHLQAIRERRPAFALAGGISLSVVVTIGYLLNVVTAGHPNHGDVAVLASHDTTG